MKFKLLLIALSFVLTACQSINLAQNNHQNTATDDTQPKAAKQSAQNIESTIISYKFCDTPVLDEADEAKTENTHDVWQRINSKLSFDVPNNRRVRAQKSWYLRHPDYIKRVTQRASPYLYFIVEELEKNQLPLELALLPIVESAFDPFAYSHGRASGMWQFIPSTGKNFGLKQNWWYDGRRDIYLSTQAAIKFLKYLHKRFDGDWLHALAAYNSGEGNVNRAIRRNKRQGKTTSFWSLDLPKETKAYVPKLLALADILTNQDAHSKNWTPIPNSPYFARVSTESQIDLSLVASLADISMKDFYQLNPAYNQWATSPNGPYHILLPINQTEKFKQNLAKIPKAQRISFKKYKIKQGDSLTVIAKKFGTSVQLLKDNNNIRNNAIRAGKSLLIPVASATRDAYHKSTQQRLLAKHNAKRKGQKVVYRVKSGDSMWDISRKYKVNIRALAKWNNMAPTDPLKIGQKLVIWSKKPEKLITLASAHKKTKKIRYKVRRGDSFARIADKFNINLNSVKKWNKHKGQKKYLQPGDSLTLYVDITRQF